MPSISPSRVHVGSSGHFWSTYQCIAEEAHKPSEVAEPDYWAHVASSRIFRVHDELKVRCEDGQWSVDLVVTAVLNRAIRVRVTDEWTSPDFASDEVAIPPTAGVYVKWKGPALKWCIIRSSDGAIIKEGLAAKSDANREALEYEKVMG
jgi:hypothetical protein